MGAARPILLSFDRADMSDTPFELIDQALQSGGPEAGFRLLAQKALDDRNYPLLFEIRLLEKRHALGLPLIQVDDTAPMASDTRREYDKAFIDAAREVGGLFLGEGNIPRAWPYFRAIGETGPVAAAIERFDSQEGVEPIIEIAYMERVSPYKGFQMILSNYGICRAITSFGQFPSREGRDESLRLLVRTLHSELVESFKRVIERNGEQPPDTRSVPELMAGRDWLFEGHSYYVDTSHLTSVLRYSLDLNDHETLGLAVELAEYGTKLGSMFQERSEPPFEDFYIDHRMYLRALRGEDADQAVAHFKAKVESYDVNETGSGPAQILVGLLARLDRYSEAIDLSVRYLSDVSPSDLACPSVMQLCFAAGDFERLRALAKERGDVLNYAAQALAGLNRVPA
jgi:hypothetical protein